MAKGSVLSTNQGRFLILVAVVMTWALLTPFNSVQEAYGQSGSELPCPELPLVKKKLIVGTKDAPPFSMKKHGKWIGISIDLWEQIAGELNLSYEFEQRDNNDELLKDLKDGKLDVVVADLTITPERLESGDFTYPFYTTGLGIAVPTVHKIGYSYISFSYLFDTVQQFFTWDFLKLITVIIFTSLLAGIAVWLFERKHNSDHFGGDAIRGAVDGIWFSAVSAIRYGEKHPKTIGGRIVTLIWMYTGVVLLVLIKTIIAFAPKNMV